MATNQKTIIVQAGNSTAMTTTKLNDQLPGVPCPDPAGYKYVGARYVPLFADPIQWDETKQTTYEPLTIVLYQGNSYTSKQYVPVGIDITNEEFWAETGSYNAQVEQYRQEVMSFDERITENTNNIADISKVTQNQTMLVFGDSWSNYDYTDKPYWHEYVSKFYGLQTLNYAIEGAGIISGGGASVPSQVNKAISEVSAKDNVAKIYILCGINDYTQNMDNLSITLNSMLNDLQENFVNAEIEFIKNGNSADFATVQNQARYTFNVAAACNMRGVKFLNLCRLILNHVNFENSYSHPSVMGSYILAAAILNNKSINWKTFGVTNLRGNILTGLNDTENFTFTNTNAYVNNGFFNALASVTSTNSTSLSGKYLRLGGEVEFINVEIYGRDSENNLVYCGYGIVFYGYNVLLQLTNKYDPSKEVIIAVCGKFSGC